MLQVPDIEHPTSAERILRTALELFAAKGYDATAVREICEAAGITRPTLYHFYGSKDGVLQALVGNGFAQYRQLVDSALDRPGSFRQRMKILARALFESAQQQPHFWRFMHNVLWAPSRTALHTDACTAFYEGVVAVMAQAADLAAEAGEFSGGPSRVRMLILMGAISEATTGHVISGRPELTPMLADQLIDTILDGWSNQIL